MNCKLLSMLFSVLVLALGVSMYASAAQSRVGAVKLVRMAASFTTASGIATRGSNSSQEAQATGTTSSKLGGKQSAAPVSVAEREGEQRAKISATVAGRVVDGNTGKPIENAIVQWTFAGQSHSGYTDARGQFKLLVASARRTDAGRNFAISANGEVSLRTVANLYQTQDTRVQVAQGKTVSVEVRLTPKPQEEIGEVRGTVTNKDDGKPLVNAIVSILGAGDPMETTTGADGSYKISGVGFSQNLTIEIKTRNAPCIATVVQPLEVMSRVVTVNVATPVLKLPILHCST